MAAILTGFSSPATWSTGASATSTRRRPSVRGSSSAPPLLETEKTSPAPSPVRMNERRVGRIKMFSQIPGTEGARPAIDLEAHDPDPTGDHPRRRRGLPARDRPSGLRRNRGLVAPPLRRSDLARAGFGRDPGRDGAAMIVSRGGRWVGCVRVAQRSTHGDDEPPGRAAFAQVSAAGMRRARISRHDLRERIRDIFQHRGGSLRRGAVGFDRLPFDGRAPRASGVWLPPLLSVPAFHSRCLHDFAGEVEAGQHDCIPKELGGPSLLRGVWYI